MKKTLILFLLLSSRITFAESSEPSLDPFTPTGPSWTIAARGEKPYTFELVYGKTNTRLPEKGVTITGSPTFVVTDDFLEQAKKITIGIKPEDTNIFEGISGEKLILKTKKDGHEFKIQMFCKLEIPLEPGMSGATSRTINTSLLLKEAEWIVMEGTSQTSSTKNDGTIVTGELVYDYLAVRISKNGGEPVE